MNAPDKAVAFEALMKDTPGFDHYDSGYDGILPECRNCRFHRPYGNISPAYSRNAHIALPSSPQRR